MNASAYAREALVYLPHGGLLVSGASHDRDLLPCEALLLGWLGESSLFGLCRVGLLNPRAPGGDEYHGNFSGHLQRAELQRIVVRV